MLSIIVLKNLELKNINCLKLNKTNKFLANMKYRYNVFEMKSFSYDKDNPYAPSMYTDVASFIEYNGPYANYYNYYNVLRFETSDDIYTVKFNFKIKFKKIIIGSCVNNLVASSKLFTYILPRHRVPAAQFL